MNIFLIPITNEHCICWSFTSLLLTLGLNLMGFLQNTWIYQNLVNPLPFGGKEWSTFKMGKCEVLAFLCPWYKGRRKLYLCVRLVEKVLVAKSKWSHCVLKPLWTLIMSWINKVENICGITLFFGWIQSPWFHDIILCALEMILSTLTTSFSSSTHLYGYEKSH